MRGGEGGGEGRLTQKQARKGAVDQYAGNQ